jgi:gliding motility-associated-like protein
MRLSRLFFLLLLCFFSIRVSAQNYVPNPSFESNTSVPNYYGQWYLCNDWWSVNNVPQLWPYASPDYLHTAGFGGMTLPNSPFGFVPPPISGNAVMGMCPWLGTSPNFREYLSCELDSTMIAGVEYEVSFRICSGLTGSAWSISSLGIHFSSAPLVQMFHEPIPVTPQWVYPGQMQSTNWTTVTFYYTPTVNQTHLTLGNFLNDANTTAIPYRAGDFWAYYFVDDFRVGPSADLHISGDTVYCFGDSIHLLGENDSVIGWVDINFPNIFISTDSTLDTFLTQTTTFLCYAVNDTDTVTVHIINYPVIDLGPDTTICENQGMFLNPVTGAYDYLWNNGSTNPTIPVTQDGMYWVTVTAQICSVTDTIIITYAPIPIIDLGADTLLCSGESILLDATNTFPSTYVWQDGATSSTYLVSSPGQYWVSVTDSMCTNADTINVGYYPETPVDLGADTTICQGSSVTLSVGWVAASYLWSDGSLASTLTITTSGTYGVTVVSGNGCTYSDEIVVTVVPPPVVNLGADTTLCAGQTLMLNAGNAGATYLWQDGSAAQTFSVSNSGNYSVTVSIGACSNSDAITVTYNNASLNLGPDQDLCQGQSLTLNATSAGATYLWQNGSTAPTLVVTTGGTYAVTMTSGNCVFTDEVIVTLHELPTVHLPHDTLLCDGDVLLLDATNSSATSYAWSTGASTASLSVNSQGLYSVTVSNSCGNASDGILVHYQNCHCRVFMPNTFTPNNDESNDRFGAVSECQLQEYHLIIFDRWGKLLFESFMISDGWDGTFEGNPVPEGVYVFHLDFVTDEGVASRPVQGTVSLIR